MRLRTWLGGTVGLASLAAASLYTYRPRLVASVAPLANVQAALGGLEPTPVLAGVGAVLTLYAALRAWQPFSRDASPTDGSAAARFAAARERPPEFVYGDDRARTAAAMDATVTGAVDGSRDALTTTRNALRSTAVAVLDRADGVDDAEAAVAAGAWTDDRVAAAFLADDASYPLLSRLRSWVDPAAARERRIERTLAAIEERRGRDE
ncbi:hypothetical protein [Salarchaeum sp. JOR-1]|uniref:DUF7269 family protein n=1 Tax=Salarchaeum sp. JOR-1 TaxID=2599399 RepID=UPI001198854C|nr:hypothetical protein [Salarchaeum sp. JOR-1]QDX41437.1 hypothetical protein FQU85_11190 [Salarchaeum sp. JOR-1]